MGRKTTVKIDNEQEIVDLYLSGEPMIKIAERYEGAKHHHIDWILKKHNVKKRSNKQNSRKFDLNHRYFDVIDTEEKAYWLGFMTADGYVTGTNYVALALKKSDESHVEKLKTAIDATYDVKTYKAGEGFQCARLMVTSEEMVADLHKHGVTHQKSLTLKYPAIPAELERHYIRGYFDGDGSITRYKNQYQFKLLGTKEMLNAVLDKIGYAGRTLYQRHVGSDVNNYYISIGGNKQVLSILSYLYDDSTVYLERKYQRFVQLKTQSH